MTQHAPHPAPSYAGQPYPGQPHPGQYFPGRPHPGGYPHGPGAGGYPPPRRSRAGKIVGGIVGGFVAIIVAIFVLVMIFGNPVVAAEQVEAQIATQYGVPAEAISCPSSLEGEVGVQMTCTGTEGGATTPLLVQVTSVEGDTVNFDITPQ